MFGNGFLGEMKSTFLTSFGRDRLVMNFLSITQRNSFDCKLEQEHFDTEERFREVTNNRVEPSSVDHTRDETFDWTKQLS